MIFDPEIDDIAALPKTFILVVRLNRLFAFFVLCLLFSTSAWASGVSCCHQCQCNLECAGPMPANHCVLYPYVNFPGQDGRQIRVTVNVRETAGACDSASVSASKHECDLYCRDRANHPVSGWICPGEEGPRMFSCRNLAPTALASSATQPSGSCRVLQPQTWGQQRLY